MTRVFSHRSVIATPAIVLAVLVALTTCTDQPTGSVPSSAPVVPLPPSADAVAASGPVVLVGAGNITRCDGSNDERTALLLDGIAGTVFTTGDNIHASATITDYQDCYRPSWGRHVGRTRPAAGDDDHKVAGATGYYEYFGAEAGEAGKGYYSYNLGAWHIVVLNSSVSMAPGLAQEQWLRDDLSRTTQPCVLAYWHHPRFSSYGTAVRAEVKPLWDALYAAQADVVVNGHYRVYERFANQNPAGGAEPERGIRQFTVGTGGHGVSTFGTPRPNSEVRLGGVYGVLKLSLDAGSYAWEFVPVAGQTLTDAGTGQCHGRPGGPPPPPTNQPPIANPGGPYLGQNTVTFDGSASSDPDNNLPLTFAWDLGDGTTASVANPTKTYPADASFTATLVVTDALDLQSAPATVTVTTANVAPTVGAGADAGVRRGTPFELSATFADPGGTADAPWTWIISWGDGNTESGRSTDQAAPIAATHTYAAAGRFTVSVGVTDKDGGTGTDEVTVTVTDPATSVVLVGAGNIARCDATNDEKTALLLDPIDGAVFTTGDNVHSTSTAADYTNCYGSSWGRHLARTRPTPGDVDYLTTGASAYFGYFGAAAGDPAKGYYSYDLGAWHIVVLNSSVGMAAGSAQDLWLKADLAQYQRACVLAYWHFPRFSSFSTAVRTEVKPLWDALYAAGADVVVNGHYRLYERFAPQNPAGGADPDRGIRQFTVGTGGHGVNPFNTPRPNSEVRLSGAYGVLKLTLDPTSYSWEFIPIAGQTLSDAGTTQCSPLPDGGPPPNQRPAATISAPAVGATYRAGDVITYGGSGSDPEDGPLPAGRLTWWADFHHDTHTHPFLPETPGTAGGTVTIPTVGETAANVWYRFHLIATDAQGLADTAFRDVRPQTAALTLGTVPAGLQVTLDGQPRTTPLTITGVVGIQRELGVVSPQTSGTTTYTFTSWSDGGAATHTIATPGSNTTYTATYTATSTNNPPSVSLVEPSNGGSAQVNTTVTITADASDGDGTVRLVEFFDGMTPLGTVASSPYTIVWTPTATGVHSLTARATDNADAVTTSTVVSFTVTSPPGDDTEPPTASLTSPSDGATALTGSLVVRANAADNVGVVGVQFQVDGENLGAEDGTAPYEATLPATSAYTTGVHVLRARSRDGAGNLSSWAVVTVGFGNSVDVPAGFSRSTYTSGLAATTGMAFAPDGRLFICEQNGAIRVVPAGGGAPLTTAFHTFTVRNSGEQGLLGIAFHPDFATNRFVYVYYTSPTPTNHNRISRIVASADPNVSTGVETILLDDLPAVGVGGNHNGGALHFSPTDRKLYVAIGDQGHSSNAMDMSSRFGKVLRYNDDLTIPSDNPFFGTATGVFRAIWALGLRNPFTFAFQPVTGRMMINDVGEQTWEEVNEGARGANYGWPTTEGPTTDPRFRTPIYAYRHSGGIVRGDAVVGATFYNPVTRTFPPAYAGNYFFADYGSGWINRLDLASENAVYAFARTGNDVFGLEAGPDGALYALARGTTFLVYRYQFP